MVEEPIVLTAEQAAERLLLRIDDEHADVRITLNKMHALLYRAQGHHLLEYGVPLFSDEIHTVSGIPIVPSLEEKYRKHANRVLRWTGKNPHLRLRMSKNREKRWTFPIAVTINEVWRSYGEISIKELVGSRLVRIDGEIRHVPRYIRRETLLSLDDIREDFTDAL